MKIQRGSALVVTLSILGVLAVIVGIVVMMLVNAANFGNRSEVSIQKVWENNQNILGQYTLKVQEIASVPEMYKNDLKEVMTSVMTARMGADGSKAMFQWFKEQNIPYDSAMYGKIQQVIEAGRNEFQNAQTRLVDEKAVYQTALGSIPQGWLLGFVGYPKIDLDKYKPVVAADTRQVFEQGTQAPIQLRAAPAKP
jgi:hypothetical protein